MHEQEIDDLFLQNIAPQLPPEIQKLEKEEQLIWLKQVFKDYRKKNKKMHKKKKNYIQYIKKLLKNIINLN